MPHVGTISFLQVQNAVIALMTYFKIKTNPQTVFAISDDVGNDGELKGDLRERLDEMVKSTMSLARSKI